MTFFYSAVIFGDILGILFPLLEQVLINEFLNTLQDQIVLLPSTAGAHYTNAEDVSEV